MSNSERNERTESERQDDVLFLMNISILDGDVEHRISIPVVMVQNISANDRRHSGEHLLELTIVRLTGEYRMSLWAPVVSVAPLETESTGECNERRSQMPREFIPETL